MAPTAAACRGRARGGGIMLRRLSRGPALTDRPLFQRFVDDELARTPALVDARRSTAPCNCCPRRTAASGGERAPPLRARRGAATRRRPIREAFVESLSQRVREATRRERAASRSPSRAAAGAGLELMDESRVEVDIEISRAMQLIDTTAEWELRELQTFTSTLTGQTHVSAESNPFRPLVYATALWDAACGRQPAGAARDRAARRHRRRRRPAEERLGRRLHPARIARRRAGHLPHRDPAVGRARRRAPGRRTARARARSSALLAEHAGRRRPATRPRASADAAVARGRQRLRPVAARRARPTRVRAGPAAARRIAAAPAGR